MKYLDLDITRRLEMSIAIMGSPREYREEEVEVIVHMTVNVNPKLNMIHALDIYNSGFQHEYINDPVKRQLIDLWCKTHYGDLSLREFLDCASSSPTGLSKVP